MSPLEHSKGRAEALVARLKQRGYRLTPQRQAIVERLVEHPGHRTADELYAQVRAVYPMVSLATVYKTLALLKAEGELLELELGSGGSRFDAANPAPHPHLICTQCGAVVDPEIALLEDLTAALEAHHGYQIQSQRMDFFGLCPRCRPDAPLAK